MIYTCIEYSMFEISHTSTKARTSAGFKFALLPYTSHPKTQKEAVMPAGVPRSPGPETPHMVADGGAASTAKAKRDPEIWVETTLRRKGGGGERSKGPTC